MAVFEALYSKDGGLPLGYICKADPYKCKRVVRTRKGIVLHLWRVHKVRLQLVIDLRDTRPVEDLTVLD